MASMMTEEEINIQLEEAIQRYAKKEVDKKRAFTFYLLGFQTATIIVQIAAIIKMLLK
jgi:hypothetical protein